MGKEMEPLDGVLWFRRIEMIANRRLGCVGNSLRHASHLMLLAPAPFRQHIGLVIDEEQFEALLDSEDFDSAARHLVAQQGVLTFERATDATPIKATIGCLVLKRAVDGYGETVADAVLDAWSAHILALKEYFDAAVTPIWTNNVAVLQTDPHRKARRLVH